MSGDKCRWFNKNGFAFGTGECVLHRRVCGSGHKVCEQYEEYEPRPHGEWEACLDTEYCKCSYCETVMMLEESVRFHFCPNCGADMRDKKDDLADIVEAVQSMKEGDEK